MASTEAGKRVADDEAPMADASRRQLEIPACKGLPREIIDSVGNLIQKQRSNP